MNWLRLLVVMVAMVGCPAVSTVLHNEEAIKVHSIDLQDTIVDLSAADSSLFADEVDDDFDSFLPSLASTLEATPYQGVYFYQSRNGSTYHYHYSIRAPPSLS